mmetsp:Transcript_23321/g.59530  ORF Transcript_23321/g.59530 Transcript_23321/m.59530 type:complete len:154 (-) Transcript_23321:130-591(-)
MARRVLLLGSLLLGLALLLGSAASGFVSGGAARRPALRATSAAADVHVRLGASSGKPSIQVEETRGNAEIGAAVVSFFVGLLFPLLGGFNLGIIFAVLGYTIANGTAAEQLSNNASGKQYAGTAVQVGDLLLQAGESGLKAVNFAGKKIDELT